MNKQFPNSLHYFYMTTYIPLSLYIYNYIIILPTISLEPKCVLKLLCVLSWRILQSPEGFPIQKGSISFVVICLHMLFESRKWNKIIWNTTVALYINNCQYIYMYIYIRVCVSVCVSVCMKIRRSYSFLKKSYKPSNFEQLCQRLGQYTEAVG